VWLFLSPRSRAKEPEVLSSRTIGGYIKGLFGISCFLYTPQPSILLLVLTVLSPRHGGARSRAPSLSPSPPCVGKRDGDIYIYIERERERERDRDEWASEQDETRGKLISNKLLVFDTVIYSFLPHSFLFYLSLPLPLFLSFVPSLAAG
jgi:hypothetical protein